MRWGSDRPYGLGLSRDGHIVFVSVYLTIVLLLAAFGVWRFSATLIARQAALAQMQALREKAARIRLLHVSFYPPIAVRLQQEGDVLLDVHVLPDGSVGDAKVMHSSGSPHLDAAALISAGYWRYRPLIQGGKAVAHDVKVDLRYHLQR